MKHLKSILLGLLISTQAFAGLPPTTMKGQSDSGKSVTFNLQAPNSQATRIDGTTALIETGNANKLANPGFEGGTTGWTASGGLTTTTTSTAANVGSGSKAYDWDSNASSQTLTSTAVSITSGDGLSGQNVVASCRFKAASGTATHKLQLLSGSTSISEVTIASSTSGYVRSTVPIVSAPASGSISLQVLSVASNEPEIFIDDCYLGLAEGFNLSQVSQAALYGSMTVSAVNCAWQNTSTQTSYGGFPADADCASGYTVTDNASAPSTNIPGLKFASLPPGDYQVVVTGTMYSGSAGSNAAEFAINDGTNTFGYGVAGATASASANQVYTGSVIGRVKYTTAQSNVTFQVVSRTFNGFTAGTQNIYAQLSTSPLRIDVYRFPTSTEQAYRPDVQAASWSGYHSSDCSWPRTSTSFGDPTADGTCTFAERTNTNFGTVTSAQSAGSNLPGIVFTPSSATKYFVCATAQTYQTTTGTYGALSLTDGTTEIGSATNNATTSVVSVPVCGVYSATSTSPVTLKLQSKSDSSTVNIGYASAYHSVEWSIVRIGQSVPAPVLVGSVTSNSSGQERIERAVISASGGAALSQSGSWVTTSTSNSTGNLTVTIAAGIFSAAPTCTCSPQANGSTQANFCQVDTQTAATATTVRFATFNDAGSAAARDLNIHCMGPR
jgi:hypothetical protein